MMIIDPPFALLLGASVALANSCGERLIPNRDKIFSRGLIAQALVISPLTLYYVVHFSDWECSYLFDAAAYFSSATGHIALITFLIVLNALYIVSFKLAESWLASDKRHLVKGFIATMVAYCLFATAYFWEETSSSGVKAVFDTGSAPSALADTEFMISTAIIFISLTAAFVWALLGNKKTA